MPRDRPEPPPFEPEWLERSLNRYLAAGLVFMVLLLAGFIAYRVREPGLRRSATRAQTTSYKAIGNQIFSANCAQCHGKDANGGGSAPTLNSSAVPQEHDRRSDLRARDRRRLGHGDACVEPRLRRHVHR